MIYTSILLCLILNVYQTISSCSFNIEAVTQTPTVVDNLDERSPDCDDAAVIMNSVNLSESLVAGTLKEGGLQIYNLWGEVLQSIPAPEAPPSDNENITNTAGRFNNVDVVQGYEFQKTYVVVSDRGLDQLRFFTLNQDTEQFEDITNDTVPWIFSESQEQVNEEATAYGLTTTNYGNKLTAFVSMNGQGKIAKVNIIELEDETISYEVGDILTLPVDITFCSYCDCDIFAPCCLCDENEDYADESWTACTEDDGETPQVEGMAVDPDDGTVLISQEIVGLWMTSFDDFGSADPEKLTLIDTVTDFGLNYTRIWDAEEEEYICTYEDGEEDGFGGNLVADVEGLSLYVDNDDDINGGFYVLSSQGANKFDVYSRKSFRYIGAFTISLGNDTVGHTDGVEIRNGDFGDDYPDGIIIVQDEGEDDVTNFKFASFKDVLDGLQEEDNNCDLVPTTTLPATTVLVEQTTKEADAAIQMGNHWFMICLFVIIMIYI